jgi:hypothetical protein
LTFEFGSHIFFSCAVVRQFAHVFALLTTMLMPSFATVNATQRTSFDRHV